MHTEGTDVGACLTVHPHDGEIALLVKLHQLGLVNCTHTQASFHRCNERRALEERTCQSLNCQLEFLLILHGFMKTKQSNILLACALLGFHQPSGTINAYNETTSHLRVKGTRMTGFLNTQNSLDPSHNLMRGRVGRFVEIDYAISDVVVEGSLEGCTAKGIWNIVASADVQFVVVLQQQRPLARVHLVLHRLRLDHKIRVPPLGLHLLFLRLLGHCCCKGQRRSHTQNSPA
mmetsp:Transcript_12712/g.32400  ORF Transcript_12712/g.32400 Transcript_12712/m.32400 type:complete len:232 (+) Transcript_12712:697-1392(+)